MMRKAKVKINFIRISVPEKIEFGRNTVIRMSLDPMFANPDVAFSALSTAFNNLENSYNAAQGGDKQYKAEMREDKKMVDDLLRKQAMFVERIADGDSTIILSSGFKTVKQHAPALYPEFAVVYGKLEGSIVLRHKDVKGAQAWLWQLCPDPLNDDAWVLAGVSTQVKYLISNLQTGTKYWFRSCYVTPKGMSAWSDPIAKIVV